MGMVLLYVDVVSMYPFHQMTQEFPVGYPTIYAPPEYAPCRIHNQDIECDCIGRKMVSPGVRYEHLLPRRNWNDIVYEEDFGGFICIDAIPPKDLFHPVLVCRDQERKKCIAGLEPIVQQTFCCFEVKDAVERGYQITKVYRYDKYKMSSNIWRDVIPGLFLRKLESSMNTISEELIQGFDKKIPGMGDMIRKSLREGKFKKDSAKKLCAKICINCLWGKHCENLLRGETEIFDDGTENEIFCMLKNLDKKKVELLSIQTLGDMSLVTTKPKDKNLKFTNSYIPAAIYVPAYGRRQLFLEMEKLGDRVLYNDTDSIIYKYIPGLYNIPEGKVVGDWEREDVCDIGIEEFAAFGPKSYGLKLADGTTRIKMKGLTMSRATTNLFNFEIMKQIVIQTCDRYYETGELNPKLVDIPQMNFQFNFRQFIRTVKTLKQIGFQPGELKGFIGPNYTLYPFGYEL